MGEPLTSEEAVDAVVVGGGMAGLAAADALHARGYSVELLEAGPRVGGLARSITIGGEEIEAYYHHVFPQDRELRSLIDRLGLGPELEWRPASTGTLHDGRVYPFNSPLDLLRFSPLPLRARVRLGLGSAIALIEGRDRRNDRRRVGVTGPRWFGAAGFDAVWKPLMEGKFGPYAHDVAMAWLASRMRQRANARRRGTGDRLGYVRGGLGRVAARYGEEVARGGVAVACGTPVESLRHDGARWHVRHGDRDLVARAVVACLSGEVLSSLVELPSQYAGALARIPYRGVVCVLLELDRRLGEHYWVNLLQPTEFDCLGVIEHTNFISPERYGGRHLVYLTHYVEVGGPAWQADADGLIAAAEPALRAINPAYERSWITAAHLARDRWAQPVPLAGGPMPGLPLDTGLPGLVHASLAHVYPDDRGASLALALGERAAAVAGVALEASADPIER